MPPDRLAFKPAMTRAIIARTKTQTRRTNYARWADVQPGHLVLVGETWGKLVDGTIVFATDNESTLVLAGKWHPGFTMPKTHARYTIRMTQPLRVERLHAITAADALAEGVESIAHYRLLWEQINGRNTWLPNPMVGVLTFELVTP